MFQITNPATPPTPEEIKKAAKLAYDMAHDANYMREAARMGIAKNVQTLSDVLQWLTGGDNRITFLFACVDIEDRLTRVTSVSEIESLAEEYREVVYNYNRLNGKKTEAETLPVFNWPRHSPFG